MIQFTRVVTILLLLVGFKGFSQEKELWKSYPSYKYIVGLSENENAIIAASENALFTTDVITKKTNIKTTVDGLSGLTISAVHHSKIYNKTILGYENGLLIVVEGDKIYPVIDIQNKAGITSSKKRINNFYEFENKIYISTDFGISVFDIQKRLFIDTYFIGNNGLETEVSQVTISKGKLYAATKSQGIKYINLDDPAKVDYNKWSLLIEGYLRGIETFNDVIVSFTSDNKVLTYNGSQFGVIGEDTAVIVSSQVSEGKLLVITQKSILVFNSEFQIQSIIKSDRPNDAFTDAILKNNHLYISTQDNGIRDYDMATATFSPKGLEPDGPVKNVVFGLKSSPKRIWALYGDYNSGYNPYPLDEYSISNYTFGGSWKEIKYENLLSAKSIVKATIDPSDENRIFFSSFVSGLLELKDNQVVKLHDNTNSGLESLSKDFVDIRINGSAFDASGNLWVNNSFVKNSLKKHKKNGEWESYEIDKSPPYQSSYGGLIIDSNNTKWFGSNDEGLIGYNEKRTSPLRKINENNNLPSNDVRVIAEDANKQLWIGTTAGLRILNDTGDFLTEKSLNTNSIIILDDGIGQELLYQQFITDIIVDGSNKKWIATAGSGLFYLSSNGQKTIYHFTTSNSPLPSDNIYDLEINDATGDLYIATDRGLISFASKTSASKSNLTEVFIYPNPVRPGYEGNIYITGLIDKSNVKITDITGNLVYQATAEGGKLLWDGKIFGKQKTASGVYLVFITTETGETQTEKVMIVR